MIYSFLKIFVCILKLFIRFFVWKFTNRFKWILTLLYSLKRLIKLLVIILFSEQYLIYRCIFLIYNRLTHFANFFTFIWRILAVLSEYPAPNELRMENLWIFHAIIKTISKICFIKFSMILYLILIIIDKFNMCF